MSSKQISHSGHPQSFWMWVMCLTGVDYFSTLGYQPSIAFEATGTLAPLATILLVLVTLFGALPVYCFVAKKSPHGQGSISMLERLVHGWGGKTLVLVLLGFAATDFIITKTLSAADATEHLVSNPFWPLATSQSISVDRQRLVVTMMLLVVLGGTFMRGFKEVIGIAVVIVGLYLTLNAFIIGCCVHYLVNHRELLDLWFQKLQTGQWHLEHSPLEGHGWWTIGLLCVWFFPKLALGLSGFETGVAVMPLIRGTGDESEANMAARIRNTRKLLITAALIMSVLLMGAAVSISTLIPPEHLIGPVKEGAESKPPAKDRAMAYIAHGESTARISPVFGSVFGTIYDLSTVVILWFAGASAMAGLLNLVPSYLPRYGMAPSWAAATRPLVVLFTLINLFVTWVFDASVSAQGGAYATGVLVLMTSACVATVIDKWRSRSGHWILRAPWYFLIVTVVFLYTTVANIIEKPDGIKIASCFIAAIIVSSIVSRSLRSTELRFKGFQFKDEQSAFLWTSMKHLEFPVLVPHRPGGRELLRKEDSIRKEHRLPSEVPIVFIEVNLGDTSDFLQEPTLEILEEEGRFIIRVTRCSSIAHVLTALGTELSKVGSPPEIHFGWSTESPIRANLGFLLFGEGNVPWLVHELLEKSEPDPAKRPRVVIG